MKITLFVESCTCLLCKINFKNLVNLMLMHNRPSQEYDVMKGFNVIGRIRVYLQCVEANTGTVISHVPYGIRIDVINSKEELPIDPFEKIILATITIS